MASLTVLHGCRTLQLSKGFNTLIDANDFDEVRRFKWHFHGQIGNGYAAQHLDRVDSTSKGVEVTSRTFGGWARPKG